MWINNQMLETVPKHIEEALLLKRDKIIMTLDKEGFKLREIQYILSQPLTTQRINQIINTIKQKNI